MNSDSLKQSFRATWEYVGEITGIKKNALIVGDRTVTAPKAARLEGAKIGHRVDVSTCGRGLRVAGILVSWDYGKVEIKTTPKPKKKVKEDSAQE